MAHTYTSKGRRRYRYYVCMKAQERCWDACPSPSVPAGEIERFVVDQIKCRGRDPAVVATTLAQTRRQGEEGMPEGLNREQAALERQRRDNEAELRRLAGSDDNGKLDRLADVQERMRVGHGRLTKINKELLALEDEAVDEATVADLADFDSVWDVLAPREHARFLELLIQHVEHDGQRGNISITFRPTGIETLAAELAGDKDHVA